MNLVEQKTFVIPAMAPEHLNRVDRLADELRKYKQVEFETHHKFHGGIYSRTVCAKKNHTYTGALIKVPTTLIVSGDVSIYMGERIVRMIGYHVLIGSVGRKQAFYCHEDTDMTMLFATKATTVEEVELEFTDESEELMSHHNANEVFFSGEIL